MTGQRLPMGACLLAGWSVTVSLAAQADAGRAFAQLDAEWHAALRAWSPGRGVPHPRIAFRPRFVTAAAECAGEDGAVPFLGWLVENAETEEPDADARTAYRTLERVHMQSPAIEALLLSLPQPAGGFDPDRSDGFAGHAFQASHLPAVKAAAQLVRARRIAALPARLPTEEERMKALPFLEEAIRIAPYSEAARLAKAFLLELERLQLGMRAPEIRGLDLEERPLNLSTFRGKAVLLVFWTSDSPAFRESCALQRTLAERYAGRPFAIVGVNGDRDRAAALRSAAAERMTSVSFWCGPEGVHGPTPTQWNVGRWPTTYWLDSRGEIRARNPVEPKEIDALAATLVAEAERAAATSRPK